jgi:DNA modification methylase
MNVKILEGDCVKTLPSISSSSVNLVITSPGYNLNKTYESRRSLDKYLSEFELVIDQLNRILKDSGSIVWQVGNYIHKGEIFPLDIYFYKLFKDRGFKLRNRISWTFSHGLHCSKRFSGRKEEVLWFTKSDHYKFNLDSVRIPSKYPGKKYFKGPKKGQLSGNPLGKNPSDVWNLINKEFECGIIDVPNVKNNHVEKTIHPCSFPVELVERFILALTDKGDMILDPYCGSGQTMLAALKQNRKVICCEIKKEYVKIMKKRFKLYESGKLKFREIGTPIYEPKVIAKIN